MRSARLAKILKLLTTTMTTCLYNAGEHAAKFGTLGREQPVEITAEVQGNHPNFKQNLAGKKLPTQKSARARRCLANAV